MLKDQPGHEQGSFYDAEYLCEQLIPADSFYRRFKELVTPVVDKMDLESMYCGDNGRPAISPTLMALATILQFHRGLSDREMEAACMYDIQVKYALGLKLDERPFDHSSLGDFRERLLKAGKEKEVFETILGHLVEAGLVRRDEIQRIDATHIIADIAIPTVVTLVKKGTFNVLKPLKNRQKKAWNRLAGKLDMAEYTRETVNHEMPGRMDLERRKKKLVEVVADARAVIGEASSFTEDPQIWGRVQELKRILRENTDARGGDRIPRERGYRDKPSDLMVSPIDPDARYGAKSAKKKFVGFKANVAETVESRFITNIVPMRGNVHDGKTAVETILAQDKLGFQPPKVIGDTAYSAGENRQVLKDRGIEMVAPLSLPNNRTKAIFPKHMFKHDAKKKTLTCPQGVTTKTKYIDWQKNIEMYQFPISKCSVCPVQAQCTNDQDGRRTVGISPTNAVLREAEVYNVSSSFKKDMALRPAIEGKLSELKNLHGLTRARFRGLKKLGLQCYFTAAAVNIKRWLRLLNKPRPPVLAGMRA